VHISKKDLQNKKILVIGDIILDEYIFGKVDRISPEAPVPVLNILNKEQRLGGAANVAFNCKAMGCNVEILGITGDDTDGKSLIKELSKRKINVYIEKYKEFTTLKKTRLISASQQILRIDEEKRPPKLTDTLFSTFTNKIRESDIIVFSDYGKGLLDELPKLIQQAKVFNKTCLVDPKGKDPRKFKNADFLTPNSKEIEMLIGHYSDKNDLTNKVFKIMEYNNIKNILLTKGKDGMTLFQLQGKSSFDFKAQPSEVFDVTGAGDTVISVLSVLLSINYPLKKACKIANKAGGIVVQKFGTTAITFEELF
jgi:rfaE bifunctional protein kinase chain/domain